jgi:hypothetical protein
VPSILGVAALFAGGGSALLASPALAGGVDPSSGLLSAAVYNLTPYTWTWWLRVVVEHGPTVDDPAPHRRRRRGPGPVSAIGPGPRLARRPRPEPPLPHERRSALGARRSALAECITPVTSARDALAEWPVGWTFRRLACGSTEDEEVIAVR